MAPSLRKQPIGPFYPVPALVPVHGVVAAHNAGHAPDAELVLEEGFGGAKGRFGGAGRGVSPIKKGVEVNALGAPGRGGAGHGKEVGLVAVDATGRQQT